METTNKPNTAEPIYIQAKAPLNLLQKFDTNLDPIAVSAPPAEAKRRTPEQDLIDQFIGHLNVHENDDLKISEIYNQNCKSKTRADVEFRSVSNIHWAIEAKSNDSRDKHNTVHKIFGELLKETGRTGRLDFRHAILVPLDAVNFYSRAFQSIKREKYLGFGELIPIETVFTSSPGGITQLSWEALYDSFKRS